MNRLSVLLLLVMTGLMGTPTAAHAQLLSTTPATADVSASLTASYDDDLLVRVDNAGPYEADLFIRVDLPEGVTVVHLPGGCEQSGQQLVCRSEAMLPGSYTTFPVDIIQTVRSAQRVSATAGSDLQDSRTSNNTASLVMQRLAAPAAGHADATDVVDAAIAVSMLRFAAAGAAGRVVLARDDRFADALAGTPLTAVAPLLYTATATLDPRTATEIDRVLSAGGEVLVLGGQAAVAETVLDAIRAQGHTTTRIAGSSRISTALAIADRVVADRTSVGSLATGTVVLARADGEGTAGWADSVAVGGFAALSGAPVLLTPSATMPPEVLEWIVAHDVTRSIVVGGESAVAVATTAGLPGIQRVAGADRAATAVAIADLYPRTRAHGADRRFHLVNGYVDDGWAYGLVAAGLAADESAPVLFVDTTAAPEATLQAVTSCRDNPVPMAVVGGDDQVAPQLYTDLDRLDAGAC